MGGKRAGRTGPLDALKRLRVDSTGKREVHREAHQSTISFGAMHYKLEPTISFGALLIVKLIVAL